MAGRIQNDGRLTWGQPASAEFQAHSVVWDPKRPQEVELTIEGQTQVVPFDESLGLQAAIQHVRLYARR